ncbi:hypothetical protein AAVH_14605 [Aphelenchoides avenae]|nr:hypothetical protein AAVH_14605 [Aphelenchus avenae]
MEKHRKRFKRWKRCCALMWRRKLSKRWTTTVPEAVIQEYRNKYKFVECKTSFEAIVVQYLPKLCGIKNPEDHVVLYASKVPAGCPSHLFSLCRSAKKNLRSTLKVGDHVLLGAYKVTGRESDFCKVSEDGLVQIMTKLEAKKVLYAREGTETTLEPVMVLNVFEHRFWLEAERRERELKREVGMEDLKQKHVMRVTFLNPELEVHRTFAPHASNVSRSVGTVIDYGPISAIKGTQNIRLKRRVKRREDLPRLILEKNFTAERLARMRVMPAGAVVGKGFIFPPSFDEHLLPRTRDDQAVECFVLSTSRPAIVKFDIASPKENDWLCNPAHVPGFAWMHRDFDGLAPHKEENKLKGAQFNEVKIGSAAAQGQSETHRRMVLASTRANIVDRKRHDNGYYYTSDLVFDMAEVDPFDLDACKENTMKKSVASMWEKGSIFRISEERHKRPFAEGCVLKMKCTPEKVFERYIRVGNKVKAIYRTVKVTLRITADIWARDEDQHFRPHQDKLDRLLSRKTDALFMPDFDRTGFEEQIKTFGRRKLWATFSNASLNPIGQILRDVFCWSHTPQPVDISETELRRSEEQERFDDVQLNNLKTMVASKGRACIMDAPSGTGKTDLCTEFLAESLTRDWVEYGARESFPVIVFKSNANLVNAIRSMTEHIPGFRPVLLVSTSAGERLDDCDITPEEFGTFASRSILRDREGFMRAHMSGEDRAFLEDYHAKHDAHPRRSYCEQKAFGLLLQYYQPSAIFATSSTLEVYADVLCERTTHMVIDDGGQFDVATVLCLLCKFPKLEQVIISGDSKQPNNYQKGIPEELWKYGGHSVMGLIAKGFPISLGMNRDYRSASILSQALSYAAYDGRLEHADGHPPTPMPDWRRILMPLLPNPDVPILLVDVRGHHEFAHYGTSSVNYEEQEVVLELVKRLRRILDARVSIAVLSPYLAQTIEMKRMLRGATRGAIGINPVTHLGYNCYVRTVDSFVGRVADIVILSTVQSFDADDDDARDLRLLAYNEFFKHAGRALSAVSRPVHAFFMVANMEALEVNAVYRRYLEFARRHTTVVTSEYRLVTFCPPTYAPYVQAKASYPGLLGLAYSDLPGHIALLDGNLQYEVGKVYQVRIRRIDDAQNDVAQATGTQFCIVVGTILDFFREEPNEDFRNSLLDQVPWRREDPDITASTDPFYEGIVYALRPLYILAYVPQFGFSVLALKTEVRPDVGARLRFRLKEAEGFIIRLDIPYQAVAVEEVGNVTDEQLLEVQKIVNARKEQASDAQPGPSTSSASGSVQRPRATSDVEEGERPGPLYEGVVYETEPTLVYAYVSSLRETIVALMTDAFQPAVGALLKFRLKHSFRSFGLHVADSPEEIGVADNERLLDVYKKVYPRQEFRDAQRLRPSNGKVVVSPAAGVRRQVEAPKPTFAAPKDWNFAAMDGKASDLLGVAVATANGTTTFYTRLGSVEIPVETQLGVWVRMDVTLTEGRVQESDEIINIEQLVPPPLDTRVIGQRILLTAEVEKRPEGISNQFLGRVVESPTVLSLLPHDSPYGTFVAELEFVEGRFHVIRYHKPSSVGVPATVPLEESAYPFPED